jgi:pectate lyase
VANHVHTIRNRGWRLAGLGGLVAALVAGTFAVAIPNAMAATLFRADFESGISGWSTSGGAWSAVADGSQVAEQSNAGIDQAREFAGSSSWTDYWVQARVKPLSLPTATSVVALAARASGSTKMYRLALTKANTAELQYMNGSSITVLATASLSIVTGTWYTLRVDISGNTIKGYVNGSSIGSSTSTAITAGRIGLFTGHATARFDDVLVSDSATVPPTTPTTPPSTTPTTPPSTPPPVDSTGLIGWATQGGGTTGGGSGSTVTVTTLADLITQARSATVQTVRVSGNFTCSADVTISSNKSIVGVGSGSGLTGCGLKMSSVSNVIVRNMNISKVRAGNGNGDAIHIDGATRLWIDHNDLSSDTAHDIDYYDGLLDITHAADYITVSWNKIHDHLKCSLVGHSDNNASEDTGHLRITYHHNFFNNCEQRNPRVRFGTVHVLNNYYYNSETFTYSYGIASTENASVLVEGNYFQGVTDPTHIGEAASGPGYLVARDNHLDNSGVILTNGSVGSMPYPYSADSAATVKASVTAGAGAGKIAT